MPIPKDAVELEEITHKISQTKCIFFIQVIAPQAITIYYELVLFTCFVDNKISIIGFISQSFYYGKHWGPFKKTKKIE